MYFYMMMKWLPATTGSVELSDWGRTGVATTGSLSSYKGGTLGVAKTRVLGEEKGGVRWGKRRKYLFFTRGRCCSATPAEGRPPEREGKKYFSSSSTHPHHQDQTWPFTSLLRALLGFFSFFFPKRNKKNIADIAPYIELYYSHFKTIKFSFSYFAILDGEMIFFFYLFLMLCLKKIFWLAAKSLAKVRMSRDNVLSSITGSLLISRIEEDEGGLINWPT